MRRREAPETEDGPALLAGRYVIEGTLARGGMGVVLAARDLRGGDVAIKRVTEDGRILSTTRFLREARIAASLESEHVVRILDSGMDGGRPYLVMERLVGEDLGAELAARGAMSVTGVADVLLQVCSGLSHAHATGIVHRDIKPSNLFRHHCPDGTLVVKVLDFGISKSLLGEGEATLTRSRDGMIGSPPFMSPEQIRDSHDVDLRTDIWSLGVVAYRLLTGEMPFEGDSVGSLFAAVLERAPKRLADATRRASSGFDDVIATCLAKDPADRFGDVAALAAAVAPYASATLRPLACEIADRLRDSVPPRAPASDKHERLAKKERTATITGGKAFAALRSLVPPTTASTRTAPTRTRGGRMVVGALGGVALVCASLLSVLAVAHADTPQPARAPRTAILLREAYVEIKPPVAAAKLEAAPAVASAVASAPVLEPRPAIAPAWAIPTTPATSESLPVVRQGLYENPYH